jgi:uncharacterized repeat protein (TIGR01451 family)
MRLLPGSIVFSAALLAAFPTSAQFGPETMFLSEGPRTIDLSDLDNDGDADLTIGARDGTTVRMNFDGLGAWTQPTLVDPLMVMARIMDVNGDGYADLCGGLDFNDGLRWHMNMGTFGFGPEQTIISNLGPQLLRDADLDADGDMDLLVSLSSGNIVWSENVDGQGTFGPFTTIATMAVAKSIEVTDLDMDGDLDIVWSNWLMGEVSCAMNQGSATFAAPVVLAAEGQGRIGDVDGDGHADVVAGDIVSGELFWHRNTLGNGVFAAPQDIGSATTDIEQMLVQDLDADGDLDIVVASAMLDDIAWYENIDGQGTYGPRQVIAVAIDDVVVLAAGDIDGDGDAEVFAGSTALNRVVYYENLTFTAGRILGRVFNDIDEDGLFNGSDHGLADVQVNVPGVGIAYTNHSGMYWLDVPTGNFDVEVSPMPDWAATTPTLRTASLLNNGSTAHTDFGMSADGPLIRLQPTLTNGAMRCNEEVRYWISVKNTGNTACDMNLALDLDDLTSFVGAQPQATVQGGVAYWTFPSVQPSHHRYLEIVVLLPGPDHLGDTLHDVLTATAMINGVAHSTHVAAIDPVLICAYDPNDKQVFPLGIGEDQLTPMGTMLTYIVRFQNTGNASATDVEIQDQLDADLDLSSMQVVSASHTQRTIVEPSGLVRFRFDGIHLPDSASDMAGSQGYVRFTIRHQQGLPEATEVHNTAAIYFDFNPPIITNTVLNTLTYGTVGIAEPIDLTSALAVYPNPMGEHAQVRLDASLQGRVDMSLTDAMGRQVRNWSSMGGTTTTILRNGLPAGIYLLRATGNGLDRTLRLVFE